MRLISTKDKNITSTFEDALFTPMPSDGGLWFFEKINKMDEEFLENWKSMTLPEIGFRVFRHFDQEKEISDTDLKNICNDAFNFPLKVKKWKNHGI